MNGPLGVRADGDESRAVRWGTIKGDVIDLLEDIPERPNYHDLDDGQIKEELLAKVKEWEEVQHGMSDSQKVKAEKVVKIASGQGFIVALKANGEVWLRQVHETQQSHWEYVSFSPPPFLL
jgi:SCF-associated factor 1